MIWRLRFVCCGRDDGDKFFDDWDVADRFRESYTSGPGVVTCSDSILAGHQRAGIIERIG